MIARIIGMRYRTLRTTDSGDPPTPTQARRPSAVLG
ncbi:Uncharacterised protein [Mycobacteroides abscessus subsp. abscessus]|nr:Uncharacterised protein [Mycobacteroides abscessus subsp. abscessus]SKV98389.1 Uncharacterised protein [Mycobacteroides abscessus subsp. abscessus]